MTLQLKNYISNKLYSSTFKSIPIEYLGEVQYKLRAITKELRDSCQPSFRYRIVYRGPRNTRGKMPWDTSKTNYWEDWTRKENAVAFDVYITQINDEDFASIYFQPTVISFLVRTFNEMNFVKDSLGNILKVDDIVAFYNGCLENHGQLSLGQINNFLTCSGKQLVRVTEANSGEIYSKYPADLIAGKQ